MDKVTFYNISNSKEKNSINFVEGPQYSRKNKGSINGVSEKIIDSMNDVFSELYKSDKKECNITDLDNYFNRVREKNAAKVRTLKKQEASGFALVGGLTIIGTIILSIIIFTIIGNIVM